MTQSQPDPANYRAMSVPHDSLEAADEAVKAFFADVKAARQKHRISDAMVIVCANIKDEQGEEYNSMARCHYGDPLKAETMTAWAYGSEQADHRLLIEKLASGKMKDRK